MLTQPSVYWRIMSHQSVRMLLLALALTAVVNGAHAKDSDLDSKRDGDDGDSPRILKDESQLTSGSITVKGVKLTYQAEAGVEVVYVKDPKDDDPLPKNDKGDPPPIPLHASMSYVAYFKSTGDQQDAHRPITFLFNGGPGSSTVWLHMGAFGPKRVITANDSHSPAAPYRVTDNEYSLLDASDLVFVDAPGTGFSHLRGTDKEKSFYGVDQDAHAFANFIVQFLSTHGRWNSAKYLFGESYGTTRAAQLAYLLQTEKSLDFNGVILLSQILSFDNGADAPQANPGVDQPYVLTLPSYTATAWYHHKLPNQPEALEPLLTEVEQFALNDYWRALMAGNTLSPERRTEIAGRLHAYTGLPQDYIERANLRINVGEFEKTLLGSDLTTGRLDSRFAGPTIDPMSKEADYDPQSAAISSAYVSAFNDYVRKTLKFGSRMIYKEEIDIEKNWDYQHQPPGAPGKLPQAVNVEPDLAFAMKMNPQLKIMMNGGYFDLATPFFAATYELQQLPIQPALQKNIEMHYYTSGHMVYAHEPDLKLLHDNVAAFINKTHGP
jgi:carboxypeptidase C (cathepsin A)